LISDVTAFSVLELCPCYVSWKWSHLCLMDTLLHLLSSFYHFKTVVISH